MNAFIAQITPAIAATLIVAGCATAPSGPAITLDSVVRDAAPASPRWVPAEPEAVELRVWRNFVALPAKRGMRLEPGDVLQTGPRSAAAIVFSGAATGEGTVTLDESTRVRVGSLEVFFGRIFANVRGLFETTSENIVAGVEGTSYLFEVARNRDVRVAVAEGVVTCRPKSAGWAPIRLQPGQMLSSSYPSQAPPRVGAADPRELRDAMAWAAEVAKAAEPPAPPPELPPMIIRFPGSFGGSPSGDTPAGSPGTDRYPERRSPK